MASTGGLNASDRHPSQADSGLSDSARGGLDRRVGAVALHEHAGTAPDVEVGDHSRRTMLTAVSAAEAVMSGRTRWTARTASSVWLRWSLPAGSLKRWACIVPVRPRVPQTASTILRYAFSGNALTVVVRTLPSAPSLRTKVAAVASSGNSEMETKS